jgi:hypothetical protein
MDVDNDQEVHCFPRIVAGATFHNTRTWSSTRAGHRGTSLWSTSSARSGGRSAWSEAASRGGATGTGKPLLIISRCESRRFLNEREMARACAEAGFEVRVAEPDQHTDMAGFALLVNSADVMVGVHGAELTNMVFLSRGAVLIQVVSFGGLEWLTSVTFKDSVADMEVSYMDYNVKPGESSLIDQYPRNHQVRCPRRHPNVSPHAATTEATSSTAAAPTATVAAGHDTAVQAHLNRAAPAAA